MVVFQGMMHALMVIHREHGIVGLWRGSSAAVPRVSVGSASQLSTFSMAKEFVTDLQVHTNMQANIHTYTNAYVQTQALS